MLYFAFKDYLKLSNLHFWISSSFEEIKEPFKIDLKIPLSHRNVVQFNKYEIANFVEIALDYWILSSNLGFSWYTIKLTNEKLK